MSLRLLGNDVAKKVQDALNNMILHISADAYHSFAALVPRTVRFGAMDTITHLCDRSVTPQLNTLRILGNLQ
jgi:hypothetical protein